MTHVEWQDKDQRWVVIDALGDIRAMTDTRLAARALSVEIHNYDRWEMGVLGTLKLWPQKAIAKMYGVSTRTVRDAISRLADSAR